MAVSSAFADALKNQRSQINARVIEVRRMQPGFDTQALMQFLQQHLNPLAEQTAVLDESRVNSVVSVGVDVAIELVSRGVDKSTAVNAVWKTLLPAYLPMLLLNPRNVLGTLLNAALYLQSSKTARLSQWLAQMQLIAPLITDLAELRAVGQVVAWQSGVAHFREGALQLLSTLKESLMSAIFQISTSNCVNLTPLLKRNPWCDAQQTPPSLKLGQQIGEFSGFGGVFPQPPLVRALDAEDPHQATAFVVKSLDRYWYLCADAFGAVLHASSELEFNAAQAAPSAAHAELQGSDIVLASQRCNTGFPAEGLQLALGRHTAAVTSPFSHVIKLFALP